MPYLAGQRRFLPAAQISDLTSGSLTLPSAPVAQYSEVFEAISSTVLSSNTGTVTFSSIPSGYNALQLRILVRSTRASNSTDGFQMTFNASNTSYYEQIFETAGGSSVSGIARNNLSYAYVGYYITAATAGEKQFTGLVIDIHNHANTDAYTSWMVNRAHTGTANHVGAHCGFWGFTTAVTSIELSSTTSSNLLAGSTFSLYGWKT